MKIRRKTVEAETRIAISGILRATPRSIQFFNELNAAVGTTIKRLSLDLSAVYFADSLWLGFLVSLTLRCRDNTVPFHISAVSRQLWHAVTHSHLEQVLPAPAAIETLHQQHRTIRNASAAGAGNGRGR